MVVDDCSLCKHQQWLTSGVSQKKHLLGVHRGTGLVLGRAQSNCSSTKSHLGVLLNQRFKWDREGLHTLPSPLAAVTAPLSGCMQDMQVELTDKQQCQKVGCNFPTSFHEPYISIWVIKLQAWFEEMKPTLDLYGSSALFGAGVHRLIKLDCYKFPRSSMSIECEC